MDRTGAEGCLNDRNTPSTEQFPSRGPVRLVAAWIAIPDSDYSTTTGYDERDLGVRVIYSPILIVDNLRVDHHDILTISGDPFPVGVQYHARCRAGRLTFHRLHHLAIPVTSCLDRAGSVPDLPRNVPLGGDGLRTHARAIDEELDTIEVAVSPDVDLLSLASGPVPVGKQVQHRAGTPPGLIIVEGVFRKAAGVHDSEVRADARPVVWRWLAAIVETCPDKTACKPTARYRVLPPFLRRRPITRLVDVVRADVAVHRILRVDAARGKRTRGLRFEERKLRHVAVQHVNALAHVVDPLHVERQHDSLAVRAVHRCSDRSGRIEAPCQKAHRVRDTGSHCRALRIPLLVRDRPGEDARMIAVAPDHSLELTQALRLRGEHSGFVEHEHSQPVASVEQRRCRWVV